MTRLLYEREHIIGEYNATSGLLRRYVHLNVSVPTPVNSDCATNITIISRSRKLYTLTLLRLADHPLRWRWHMIRNSPEAVNLQATARRFVVGVAFASLLASSSGARSSPDRNPVLHIARDRALCLQTRLQSEDESRITALPVSRAIYHELTQRFGAKRSSQILVQMSDNRAWPHSMCAPARGDVVVTITLAVNRTADRYYLHLAATGVSGTYTDQIRRPAAAAWGKRGALLPDSDWKRTDWWLLYVKNGIQRDANDLGSRLADHISFEPGV